MRRVLRNGLGAALLLLVLGLLALFDGTWRRGEVFSPADVLESFYPWAADGPRREPRNVTRSDEAFFHQPLMVTHWARLRAGDFPEWNPSVLGGTPAFQQGLDVGRAFSPLSAPFYLAEPNLAVTLYGPFRLLVAGLLMWLYLRAAGLAPSPSVLGAVAYAFNGAFLVWLSAPMPTVALWLPLVLLGIERVREFGRWRDAALLALAIGMQFLGGYLPTTLVMLAVGGIWAGAAFASPGTPARGRRALALLAVSAGVGLALGAAALVPMVEALWKSPAAARSMTSFTLPWPNLATFALPDFWGRPASWWYRGEGNYPEFVTYLGVSIVALAGVGAWSGARSRDRRTLVSLLVAGLALSQMYGWPPFSWLSSLPGLRQVNVHRWNVALAFAVALLAARGLQALHEDQSRRERSWRLAACLATLGLLSLVTLLALWNQLDAIRELALAAHQKLQLLRFVALAVVTAGVLALGMFWRRTATVASWLLVALALTDLVQAAYGFNPTLPRERVYARTRGLDFLEANVGTGRIVPVGPASKLPQSHVWGVYGLRALTGFDFAPDPRYQALLAHAAGLPAGRPQWDYVGIEDEHRLDLRLLGLLGVSLIVTPPTDVEPRPGGFSTVDPIDDGRRIEQCFLTRYGGFRRLDLLTATYARSNAGWWDITLTPSDGRTAAWKWRIDTAALTDLDWLRLEFAPDFGSAGRRYCVAVSGHDGAADHGATLMATGNGMEDGTLSVNGKPDSRALCFRTFSTAPERIPGATLAYAGDINVYRNPRAMPMAWFVGKTRSIPADRQVEEVASLAFDPALTALLESGLTRSQPPDGGRVLRATREDDRCSFEIEAPRGGLLVIGERFDPHWRLEADGTPLQVLRADAVLMATEVPPGTRRIILRYERRDWLVAAGLSALALLAILAAFVVEPGQR